MSAATATGPAAPTPPAAPAGGGDGAAVREALGRLRAEVGKVVVGQDAVVSGMVIALLCRGHVLLEGVPGVAKTLLIRALAAALALDSKRLQFTPDLMPGDVTGSLVYDARTAEFEFRGGPVFTNLLLADEINRTPPKTQSALLEVMEERQVSVDGNPRPLPEPFVVAATQNPVEYEGTYPLPEAQLDRFLLRVSFGYPARDDEWDVLRRRMSRKREESVIEPVVDAGTLRAMQATLEEVAVEDTIGRYIVDLVNATREHNQVLVGASPRGSLALLLCARARAVLAGRDYVVPEDVKEFAVPALSHRISLRPEVWLRRVEPSQIVAEVLAATPAPASGMVPTYRGAP
jgi:MoxR-like ATPase